MIFLVILHIEIAIEVISGEQLVVFQLIGIGDGRANRRRPTRDADRASNVCLGNERIYGARRYLDIGKARTFRICCSATGG